MSDYHPTPALHGLIEVMERKMKQKGFRIGSFDYKPDADGNLKVVKIDTAPKHVKQARKHKTARQSKAWEASKRKTT